MVAYSRRSSARPTLADDGFAPIVPVLPLPASNQAPIEPVRVTEPQELAGPALELPQPERESPRPWLDDPSYDTAAFLAGL